jgi:hypothetical protein
MAERFSGTGLRRERRGRRGMRLCRLETGVRAVFSLEGLGVLRRRGERNPGTEDAENAYVCTQPTRTSNTGARARVLAVGERILAQPGSDGLRLQKQCYTMGLKFSMPSELEVA